jgi:DNA-binding beta-propeller fold protein YncE
MSSSVSHALHRLALSTSVLFAASCHAATMQTSTASSAAGPTGTIVVSNMNDNTAMLLDARTRVLLATLPTGRAPHEVAMSHDGRWALVSNYGVRDQVGNTITVIDIAAHTVARTIDLGDYKRPHGMAFFPGDTVFAVTSEANRAVLLVDFRSGRVMRRLASGGRGPHMIGLSSDGAHMIGGNIGDGTLAIFTPLAADSARTTKVPAQPEGVAISPDGKHAWVGSNKDSVVTIVDVTTGATLATLRGFGLPYRTAITPDGARAVITDPVNANVRVFDAKTFREQHTIAIPRDSLVATAEVPGSPSPEGVTTSRDSRWAFVTLQGRNRFITIDLERGVIAGYGVTGTWSDGIAYSPRGQ